MRIGSSFDTKLKRTLIQQYIDQYGFKETIVISRSMRYLIFYAIGPTIALIAWIIVIGTLLGLDTGSNVLNSLKGFASLFFLIVSIAGGGYYIIGNIINYYMDFCIITPKEITLYEQYGVFHRKNKIARTEDIKIVTVDGSGFRRSLLDIGDMNIFFEGNYSKDSSSVSGSINLTYISSVEFTKNKIKKVLDLAVAVEHRKRD